MLKPETNKPHISYSNIMECMDYHGKIIGAILAVVPLISSDTEDEEDPRKYVTQFFFSDGYCHTAFGFAIGKERKNEENHEARVIGLQAILNLIPGLPPIPSELLTSLAENEQDEEELKQGNTLYFLFRIPEHARIASILTLPGWTALSNCIELLEDQESKINEVLDHE